MHASTRADRIFIMQCIMKIRQKYLNAAIGHKSLNLLKHTSTLCSCHMCGNPRKYYKRRSLKEISFMQTEGWDG